MDIVFCVLGTIGCLVLVAMFLDWFFGNPPSDPYDY